MKPVNMFNPESWRSSAVSSALAAIVLAGSASAADVTLNVSDGVGTTSFNTGPSWSNAAVPSAGNAYFVPAGRTLRSPADSTASHVFGGDSLTLTGATFNYKGGTNVNTITINNLTLDASTVNNASNSSTAFILAGNKITVTGTSTLFSNNGTITVNAPLAGTGGTLVLATNNTLGRQIILSGTNTYTGTIQVTGGSGAVLSSTGALAFTIGASAVNNTITGAVPFIFDGAFNLDLTSAGDTVGNSWTLVDTTTLVETFSATFHIPGFTENNNIWTSTNGKYQFSEATGVLSRITADTDGDGLADSWELANFGNLSQGAVDGVDGEGNFVDGDYDDDLATNLSEYQSGSNPTNPNSWPDTDGDFLNDGWEKYYFAGSLAQTAISDPDGDYNSNAVEFAAGTNPSSATSYPDTDYGGQGDQLNDGWEIRYFGSITACDPAMDSDGDLFSNLEEFFAFPASTDPTVQISSPDTDGDGLPDGWEVKYFRVGLEDLTASIGHYGATEDPDGDLYSNLAEYGASTNPNLSTSTPQALAYWRFEERTAGVVPVGNDTGGNQTNTVLDSSGLGNHMMTWRSYTSPIYGTAVPFATVPLTSAANTASLAFTRDGANLFVTDNIYTTAGVGVNSHVFNAFTIEASFNTTATNVWQVVVGKTGNPIGGQAPFSLKIRATDNKLIAGIVDGAGTAKEAVSTRAITTNTWFSAVVTASATELKLWIKGTADANYVLEGTTAIGGAFYTYAGVNAPWVIGLGKWNGADADPFGGNIDEVRISPKVLAPSEFLIPVVSNDTDNDGMDDTWETTHFGGLGQTATGDFDGDGTDNLTEYRLGLIPKNGNSRFATTRGTTGALTWPSALGLTFLVQRSTTLAAGSWTTVGTVTGTAGTASFTDPSPPAGRAFYKVLLQP